MVLSSNKKFQTRNGTLFQRNKYETALARGAGGVILDESTRENTLSCGDFSNVKGKQKSNVVGKG